MDTSYLRTIIKFVSENSTGGEANAQTGDALIFAIMLVAIVGLIATGIAFCLKKRNLKTAGNHIGSFSVSSSKKISTAFAVLAVVFSIVAALSFCALKSNSTKAIAQSNQSLTPTINAVVSDSGEVTFDNAVLKSTEGIDITTIEASLCSGIEPLNDVVWSIYSDQIDFYDGVIPGVKAVYSAVEGETVISFDVEGMTPEIAKSLIGKDVVALNFAYDVSPEYRTINFVDTEYGYAGDSFGEVDSLVVPNGAHWGTYIDDFYGDTVFYVEDGIYGTQDYFYQEIYGYGYYANCIGWLVEPARDKILSDVTVTPLFEEIELYTVNFADDGPGWGEIFSSDDRPIESDLIPAGSTYDVYEDLGTWYIDIYDADGYYFDYYYASPKVHSKCSGIEPSGQGIIEDGMTFTATFEKLEVFKVKLATEGNGAIYNAFTDEPITYEYLDINQGTEYYYIGDTLNIDESTVFRSFYPVADEGSIFLGWEPSEDGTIEADMTFTAKFSGSTHVITFSSATYGGAFYYEGTDTQVESIEVPDGTKYNVYEELGDWYVDFYVGEIGGDDDIYVQAIPIKDYACVSITPDGWYKPITSDMTFSATFESTVCFVAGHVYDSSAEGLVGIPNANITFRVNGVEYTYTTDLTGGFYFYNLPKNVEGTWTIAHPRYERVTETRIYTQDTDSEYFYMDPIE